MNNKNVQLVSQHCCKMSRIEMLYFLPPTDQINKSGYCRLWNIVAESREKFVIVARFTHPHPSFYRSTANLFCVKWRKSHGRFDSRIILSNQKSVFMQICNKLICKSHGRCDSRIILSSQKSVFMQICNNLICKSQGRCDSRIILSNQKSVFMQIVTTWFVVRWVVKRAASLFNSFCRIVAKQVARFCCPFCRSSTESV